MPTSTMSGIIHDLRRAVLRDGAGTTDAQLLELFVRERDDDALAALVHRHGPMVWGVCRRILSSHHDAEDAFQATFLVLVRKAAAIQHKELVANWLYGVAQQTAVRARATSAKKGRRERQVTEMPESSVTQHALWDSLQPLLDQELSRLPEKYRVLLVLCDLEGKTRKEVAEELACPEGTVAGRLARARAMLAKRLARHGITASAGALGVLLSTHGASASVPPVVVSTTIQAATLYAAGHATASAISAKAAALSEGVVKAMLMTKLKIASVWAAALVVLTLGGGALHQSLAGNPIDPSAVTAEETLISLEQERAQRPQPKDGGTVAGKLEAVAADSVTISTVLKRGEAPTPKAYTLAKDAKILRDGKEAKLTDLKTGNQATLTLSKDQKTVVSISQAAPAISSPLKSFDATKNTITITVGNRAAKEDKTYPVAKDAKIMIDGKEGKLADLKTGAPVAVVINEQNTVTQIRTATVRRERNP